MDLRQLRYFCAIAARSSFRQASDDVHVAQPALSQQIRKLEAELGVELFNRESRPTTLTDAGSALLPRAQQILADVERTRAHVREFATEFRGRITIGMMQYLAWLEVPDLLTQFKARHPAVDVQLAVGNTGQVLSLVRAGTTDLAFCHIDGLTAESDLEVEGLRTEELVVIVTPTDPLASSQRVTVETLADTPFITFMPGAGIRDALEQMFEARGLRVQVGLETSDMSTAIALVSRGFGVALIPRSTAEAHRSDGIVPIALGPVPALRQVGMVWRSGAHRSRAVEAFQISARRYISERV